MTKFTSITGLVINDESICIKGSGSTFVCICQSCKKEQQQRLTDFLNEALQDKQKEIER